MVHLHYIILVIIEIAAENVEGGLYISPEFQLGQVYDGTVADGEDVVLYRPVYGCVPHEKMCVTNTNNAGKAKRNNTEPSTEHDRLISHNHDHEEDAATTEKMTSV